MGTVVKFGGSLLTLPDWPDKLRAVLKSLSSKNTLLIVGGGAAADLVRQFQIDNGISDQRAHKLAIEAMLLNAKMVAQVLGSPVVQSLADAELAWAEESSVFPIVDAGSVLQAYENADEIVPPNWDSTSDSISAFVAGAWQFPDLLLLKSVDLPIDTTLQQAADQQFVDKLLPRMAERFSLNVEWRNVRSGQSCRSVPFA